MNNKFLYSVIISTWQRPSILYKILLSLNNQLLIPKKNIFEVIVVDSYSHDKTKAIIKLFQFNKNFKIIYTNTKKNNLSAKRNLGIKNSKTENLIFLDDDCIPEKYFIKKYKKISTSQNSIFCGIVKYPNDHINKSRYLQYRQSRHFLKNKKDLHVKNFVAMNFGIRINKLIKNKIYFDERFTGYGFEDYEFARRMLKNNFKLKTINAQIIHYELSRNFNNYLIKIYFLSKIGTLNLMRVNYSFFKDTIYFKIENNIFLKILLILKFKNFLKLVLHLLIYLESKNISGNFLVYRLGILISYIIGKAERKEINFKNKKNWYE